MFFFRNLKSLISGIRHVFWTCCNILTCTLWQYHCTPCKMKGIWTIYEIQPMKNCDCNLSTNFRRKVSLQRIYFGSFSKNPKEQFRFNCTSTPQFFQRFLALTEALTTWEDIPYSLLIKISVFYYRYSPDHCFHF